MTPDTSVVVAAFSPWHEHYEEASAAVEPIRDLIAHVEIEAYSVLTRSPAPLRSPADLVATYLADEYAGRRFVLPDRRRRALVGDLADAGVAAGAVYDALIALTTAERGLVLLTLDRRAVRVYERLGVDYRLLG